MVYLSADRLGEGLFGTPLGAGERPGLRARPVQPLGRDAASEPRPERSRSSATDLSIKAPSIDANVLSLSGGNQQKVLLARALLNQRAALLLAEEPTQGVDVGARAEIYRILRQVADAGAGVVIVSSDTRELEGLCDRVVVFSSGQVVAELRGEQVTEDAIAHAMLTSTRRRSQADRPAASRRGHRSRPGPGCAALARGDYASAGVLAVAIIALAVYTQAHNVAVPVQLQPELADRADRGDRVHLVRPGVRDPDRGHRPVRRTAGRPGRGDRLVLREQRAQRDRPGGRVPGHVRGERRGRAAQRQHGQVRPVHPDRGHAGHLHRPAGRVPGAAPVPGRVHLVLDPATRINRSVGPGRHRLPGRGRGRGRDGAGAAPVPLGPEPPGDRVRPGRRVPARRPARRHA